MTSTKGNHPREELQSILAQDKPEYVRTLFDNIAGDYDRMNWIMTGGLLALWHRAFIKETKLTAGGIALDVCCGTGDLTLLMAKHTSHTDASKGGRVVGLDFSENMLTVAKKREEAVRQGQSSTPLAPVDWVQGDAMDLPYPTGDDRRGFDCVTMGFALRNVSDVGGAIKEMARVAKSGGRVICLEVSRPDNPLMRAGFNFYFYRVVPMLGRMAERRLPEGSALQRLRPYTYLPYSLDHLPPPHDILELMKEAGLKEVRRRPLTGGVVSLYIGVKQAEGS